MLKKLMSVLVITAMVLSVTTLGYADEGKTSEDKSLTRGAASLLLPGWGQYLNNEMENKSGKLKTGAMIVLEIGGIVTTILVGTLVGYPQIWIGIGILVFNHIWSASDAYMKAPAGPEVAMKGTQVAR